MLIPELWAAKSIGWDCRVISLMNMVREDIEVDTKQCFEAGCESRILIW